MSRYAIRRPHGKQTSGWLDDEPMIPALTVYETSEDMQPIGLMDKDGNEICRLRERIGFWRD